MNVNVALKSGNQKITSYSGLIFKKCIRLVSKKSIFRYLFVGDKLGKMEIFTLDNLSLAYKIRPSTKTITNITAFSYGFNSKGEHLFHFTLQKFTWIFYNLQKVNIFGCLFFKFLTLWIPGSFACFSWRNDVFIYWLTNWRSKLPGSCRRGRPKRERDPIGFAQTAKSDDPWGCEMSGTNGAGGKGGRRGGSGWLILRRILRKRSVVVGCVEVKVAGYLSGKSLIQPTRGRL